MRDLSAVDQTRFSVVKTWIFSDGATFPTSIVRQKRLRKIFTSDILLGGRGLLPQLQPDPVFPSYVCSCVLMIGKFDCKTITSSPLDRASNTIHTVSFDCKIVAIGFCTWRERSEASSREAFGYAATCLFCICQRDRFASEFISISARSIPRSGIGRDAPIRRPSRQRW